MRRAFIALLAIAALNACGKPEANEPAVRNAWVRLAAMPGRPGAAYFTLEGGAVADRLIRVDSPKAASIELHAGGMEGGMMTMKPLSGMDIPAHGEIRFAPGGNHAMLFGIDPSVRPGTSLPLTFRFQSGKAIGAEAKVVALGDPAPKG